MRIIRINLNKMRQTIFALTSFWGMTLSAQQQLDTTKYHVEYLSEIALVGQQIKRDVLPSPEIVGTKINAGKKNAVVVMDQLNTIVVNNNMRQILAKVPGIHIWESDGSGIQIGIASRGLSPNRSWEFNTRQNGADISADPFGYPEAYYNPPMQAIQRIQIIKGAGALQYGPQFGGMINYIMRDGRTETNPVSVNTAQTIGSFGLYNNFIAIGGRKNKFYYYAFYDKRSAEGFRKNSQYQTQTTYLSGGYEINQSMNLSFDVTQYSMLSQQPGGLTDQEMIGDIKISHRARNWFSTPWLTGNIKFNWDLNSKQKLNVTGFGMIADRNSVGFTKAINIPDTVIKSTLQYSNRELSIDQYKNSGIEIGYLNNYQIGGIKQTFTAGIRYFYSNTKRFQKGIGSTGSDANFETTAIFPVEQTFNTSNYSIYAEQVFRVKKKLLLIPGIRFENIYSQASGRSGINSDGTDIKIIAPNQHRNVIIAGFGIEYHFNNGLELYGNINQAYRPILFSDMQAVPGLELVDNNLKDAHGINSDIGLRGIIGKGFYVDMSLYTMQYNNRIGRLSKYNEFNQLYTLKTNVGNSFTSGFESIVELDILAQTSLKKKFKLPFFVSYAFNNARYQHFIVSDKNAQGITTDKDLYNNYVENAPRHILRSGLNFALLGDKELGERLNLGIQFSKVSEVFNDALNTVDASANGQNGKIPAYSIYDLNVKFQAKKNLSIKLSVNNLTNSKYFTRRAGGYPGPGVMPSDGRSILVTLDVKI